MREVSHTDNLSVPRERRPHLWQRIDWRFVGFINIVVLAGNLAFAIPAELRETRRVQNEDASTVPTAEDAEPDNESPVSAMDDDAPSWDGEHLALLRAANAWGPIPLSTLANTRVGGRKLKVAEVRPDIPLIALLEDDRLPLAQQRVVACDLTPDKARVPRASVPATQPVPRTLTDGDAQVAYVFGNVKCTFDAWPAGRRTQDPVLASLMQLAARTGSGPVLRDLDVQ